MTDSTQFDVSTTYKYTVNQLLEYFIPIPPYTHPPVIYVPETLIVPPEVWAKCN